MSGSNDTGRRWKQVITLATPAKASFHIVLEKAKLTTVFYQENYMGRLCKESDHLILDDGAISSDIA